MLLSPRRGHYQQFVLVNAGMRRATTCHGARSRAVVKRSLRIVLVSCKGVERERPVAVAVAVMVTMSPKLIVDSNPATSAGRRVLSLVNMVEVNGCCLWLKAVVAW